MCSNLICRTQKIGYVMLLISKTDFSLFSNPALSCCKEMLDTFLYIQPVKLKMKLYAKPRLLMPFEMSCHVPAGLQLLSQKRMSFPYILWRIWVSQPRMAISDTLIILNCFIHWLKLLQLLVTPQTTHINLYVSAVHVVKSWKTCFYDML